MRLSVWASATPLLRVFDLARTTRFYTYGLGFSFVRGTATPADGTPAYAHLRRGGVELLVYERAPESGRAPDGGHRTLLYVAVSDVEAVTTELRIRWIRVATGELPGGGTYCDVEDPDGNVLRFGAKTQPVLEALGGAN